MAVLLGAFESCDCCRAEGCKSRLALLLGLQAVSDSGTPKFPPREAELHPRHKPSQSRALQTHSPVPPVPALVAPHPWAQGWFTLSLHSVWQPKATPEQGAPQEDVAPLDISLGPPKRAGKGFPSVPPVVRLLQKHRTCRVLFCAGNHLHPWPTLLKMEVASFPRSSRSGIAQQEARREIQVPAVPSFLQC